jgi:hypothetical protein
MQKIFNLLNAMAMLFFTSLLFACSSSRTATSSQIGLLPLESYNYTGESLTADTMYRVIRSEDVFTANFNAADAAARKPGFSGQTVVAILMKAAATPLKFTRAEVAGRIINVYAQTCSGADCPSRSAVLATIPKVGSARAVQFFINGESKARLDL